MILTWLIILAAAAYFVKLILGQGKSKKETSSPVEILKTRYASGEISREEYERLKRDLLTI